jgi:L-lactate dehydrogenase complex protein LldG
VSREAILARVRAALEGRADVAHPTTFESWGRETQADPVEDFALLFAAAGGEVVRLETVAEARAWLADFRAAFVGVVVGQTVPDGLDLGLAVQRALPEEAALGISLARGAIAETGSLILDARDGRRVQLLPPTHVVLLARSTMHRTMADAFEAVSGDLGSAIGLHSGPSKSADIGQILVKGVHGPGRVVALIVEEELA